MKIYTRAVFQKQKKKKKFNLKTWLCQFILCHQSILSCASNTCTIIDVYIFASRHGINSKLGKKLFWTDSRYGQGH